MSKHTPGPWLVWEAESEFGHDCPAGRIIIGHDRPEMMQEIAYVNCESSFFADDTPVPVPSSLVCEPYWCTAPAEALVNARLIAAAPELLEALRAFIEAGLYRSAVETDRCKARFVKAFELAHAAIKKADGDSN